MNIDTNPILLPATINIMCQLGGTTMNEHDEELGYYINNFQNGRTLIYPKPFIRLIDPKNLFSFFEEERKIEDTRAFLNGIHQLILSAPEKQPICFFKLFRMHSLLNGYNLRFMSSILNYFHKNNITNNISRQLVKSVPYYLSYQEIEFHLIYKAMKFLYVFSILLEYKLLDWSFGKLNFLFIKYLMQMKKYIQYSELLEPFLVNNIHHFMGNTTSSKGIVLNLLSTQFRQEFLYVLKFKIYGHLLTFLDKNKDVEMNEYEYCNKKISKWTNYVEHYLTMRIRFQNSGLQLINRLVQFNHNSNSYTSFMVETDSLFDRFLSIPIYNLDKLKKTFNDENYDPLPFQWFILINNLFKDKQLTLSVLGFIEPVSTILTISSIIQTRLTVTHSLFIFNKLLLKSRTMLPGSEDYFFEIFFLSEAILKRSYFELNANAFEQYFHYEIASIRLELCKMMSLFKNNLNKVHNELKGLAETKAISIYNNILFPICKNSNILKRFGDIVKLIKLLPSTEIVDVLKVGHVKSLMKGVRESLFNKYKLEGVVYVQEIKEQFKVNTKIQSIDIADFDHIIRNIGSMTDFKDISSMFTNYAYLAGETPKIQQTKDEKIQTIISFRDFLQRYEADLRIDQAFVIQNRNVFFNFDEQKLLSRQNHLVDQLNVELINRSALNEIEIIDPENFHFLSPGAVNSDLGSINIAS